MNCTKCNSEVPNGAKFCPVCGNACGTASDVKPAAAPPEPEKKNFCGKCGLELRQGAKFCAVCGAPTAGVGDIKPNQNNGAVFGGGTMSAVSLDKPRASDNLVAAMNTASAPSPSTFVPTPSNDVPRPSNDTGSGFSSGFGGSDYSSAAPAPAFIPESPVTPASPFGSANDNPFGDMGAAAVVATPIKKKSGAKVGIIIAAAVAVLVAAAAIFFFTNKATALSLIMGKPGYATMVEGNSIKAATEKLDLPAVSNGIKSASSVVSAMAAVNNDYDAIDDILGMSSTTSIQTPHGASPMMSLTSGSAFDEGVDLEAIITSYYELMMNTYGVNSVNATLGMNIDLSDNIKNMLGSETDEIIKLINGMTFTTSVTSSEDKLAASMGAESGSSVINAKTVFTKDGDVYLVLPFISDQGLKVKLPTTATSAPREEIKPLELDEKEIERLIGELVEIYLAEYKESAIEMENGELSAAGLTATGKLITAEFSGDALSDIFNKLIEHFANDEYFTTKLVDFANECGADITKEEYRDSLLEELNFDMEDSEKLIINTVVDNNGNVLAKSFKAVDGEENVKLTYVDSKEQFTLEVSESGKTVVSLVHDITSEKEGTVTIKCTDGNEGSFTVKMTYADADTAKFCGNDTFVGKYTFGIELPADFTDDVPAEIGNLSNIKLTFSNSVDGQNTMESSVGFELGNLGSISFNSTVTAENSDADLAIPSDVIDLGDMQEQPDDATVKKLEEYVKTAGEKLTELADGPFGDIIKESGILDEVVMLGDGLGSADTVPYDDVLTLGADISNTMLEISQYRTTYNVSDTALSNRTSELTNDLYTLYNEMNAKGTQVSTADFQTFKNRYNTLRSQADALKKDYEAKVPSSSTTSSTAPTNPTTPSGSSTAESLDYDKMTDDDLIEVLMEYDDRYLTLIYNDDVYAKVESDPAVNALYNECETTYNKAYDDFYQLLDTYSGGSYNVAILRNLRKSVKAYAVAVEKFEKAVQSQA